MALLSSSGTLARAAAFLVAVVVLVATLWSSPALAADARRFGVMEFMRGPDRVLLDIGSTGWAVEKGATGTLLILVRLPGNRSRWVPVASFAVTKVSGRTSEARLTYKGARKDIVPEHARAEFDAAIVRKAGKVQPVRQRGLRVTTVPEDVSIMVDGEKMGSARRGVLVLSSLKPGSYEIQAERDGYYPTSRKVVVEKGKRTEIAVELASRDSISKVKVVPITPDFVVTINGKPYGQPVRGIQALEIPLQVGEEYRLGFEKEGYQTVHRTVRTPSSDEIRVELQRLPRLQVATSPAGARVYLDGEFIGTSPLEEELPKQGAYTVELQKPGYETRRYEVTAQLGNVAYLERELFLSRVDWEAMIKECRSRALVAWIGGGVATGLAVTMLGMSAYEKANADSSWQTYLGLPCREEGTPFDARYDDVRQHVSRSRIYATVGYVSLVAGLGGLGYALSQTLKASSMESEMERALPPLVSMVPLLTPNSFGAGVNIVF